jgi:hypothetical protein
MMGAVITVQTLAGVVLGAISLAVVWVAAFSHRRMSLNGGESRSGILVSFLRV